MNGLWFRPKITAYRAVISVLGAIILFSALVVPANSQGSDQANWSPVDQVYSSARSLYPRLISDSTGTMHLIWGGLAFGQEKGEPHALMYARWDGSRWTEPVDVIVTGNVADIREPDGVVDDEGILHVIFGGPLLQYASAPAESADDARNWTEPQLIGDGEFIISRSDIVIDDNGVLHVVAADSQKNEVYYMKSADRGVTWTIPVEVSSSPDKIVTTSSRLAIDSNGVLHVVWVRNPLPESYPPQGIYYARSEDGGQTWSREQQLAGVDYGDAEIVIGESDQIHVVYNGAATISGGKYHRWSSDLGNSWTEPFEVAPKGGGLNGTPSVAVDATGALHFLGGDGNNLWYSIWQNNVWSPPVDLHALDPNEIEYTETVGATILLGNQLHVVFDDRQTEMWHTSRTLDAPPLEPVPFVDVDAVPQGATESQEVLTPTADEGVFRPILSDSDKLPDTDSDLNPSSTILAGVAVALLFLLLVLIIFRVRHRLNVRR